MSRYTTAWLLFPLLCVLAVVLTGVISPSATSDEAIRVDRVFSAAAGEPPPPPLLPLGDDDDNTTITIATTDVDPTDHLSLARSLVADNVDEATLARYRAEPSGFRRHPSYYSDKYLTRARRGGGGGTGSASTSLGSWTLVDTDAPTRADHHTDAFYDRYPHRDVPWDDLPDTAWQKDAAYLPRFLDQGIALVERAMEAILMEYGFGPDRDDRPLEERMQRLNVKDALKGNAYANLVRRVLHAIVTQDTFVFAMSGHSAAAGESVREGIVCWTLFCFVSSERPMVYSTLWYSHG